MHGSEPNSLSQKINKIFELNSIDMRLFNHIIKMHNSDEVKEEICSKLLHYFSTASYKNPDNLSSQKTNIRDFEQIYSLMFNNECESNPLAHALIYAYIRYISEGHHELNMITIFFKNIRNPQLAKTILLMSPDFKMQGIKLSFEAIVNLINFSKESISNHINLLSDSISSVEQIMSLQHKRVSSDVIDQLLMEFSNHVRFSTITPIETLTLMVNSIHNKQYQFMLLKLFARDIGDTEKFSQLLSTLPKEDIIEWFIHAGEQHDEMVIIVYNPITINRLNCSDDIKINLHIGYRMYQQLNENPLFSENFYLLTMTESSTNEHNRVGSLASGSLSILNSFINTHHMAISDLPRAQKEVLRKLAHTSRLFSQHGANAQEQTSVETYRDIHELIAELESAFLSSSGKFKNFVLARSEADPKKSQIMLHVAYLVHVLKQPDHYAELYQDISTPTATRFDTPDNTAEAELLANNARFSSITPTEATIVTTEVTVVESTSRTPGTMFHPRRATPSAPRESELVRNDDLDPTPNGSTPSAPPLSSEKLNPDDDQQRRQDDDEQHLYESHIRR